MENYQLNYSSNRPHMYDELSRQTKAARIVKALENHYGKGKLSDLTVLDVGSSTGIIDNFLADKFKKVVGTDIDKEGIEFAKRNFKKNNLTFKVEDAMSLTFPDNQFDVVICAQVYEHVPDAKKLFEEIYRVLKPQGVCYFAALNKHWPIEPHYNLPFLSWLPKSIANVYVKVFGKTQNYYETPKSYNELKILTGKFVCNDITGSILKNPERYGFENTSLNNPLVLSLNRVFSPLVKYLMPTFFWLLIKK